MLNSSEIMDIGRAIFLSYIDGVERSGQCPDTKRIYRVFRRPANWSDQKPHKFTPGEWY